MIRRVTEYVITCDCERVFGYLRCDGFGHAYSSLTAEECATSATREGWKRLGGRTWLSPDCAKLHDKEVALLNPTTTSEPEE